MEYGEIIFPKIVFIALYTFFEECFLSNNEINGFIVFYQSIIVGKKVTKPEAIAV